MGFESIGDYVNAAEGGQNHIIVMNKAGVGGVINAWHDLSGAAGYPPPNYFASSPLTAATIASPRLYLPSVAPKKQYLHNIRLLNNAASATSTVSDNASFCLMDYLLYYPFVDMTSTALQEMDNAVTLPRYVDGEGVRLMVVIQSAAGNYATSNMTVNYTNTQDQDKSIVLRLNFAGNGAPVIIAPVIHSGNPNLTTNQLFCGLAQGDSGIKRVNSVKLDTDWGGLCALVLVKPIFTGYTPQGCRRTTTGNLDSFGSPVEYQNLIHKTSAIQIEDGAYLAMAMYGPSASAPFTGTRTIAVIETVWN
jgi:hypothetical protein